MDMAIAAGGLTYPHRPPQIRQDGLEVSNDRLHTLSFRLQSQQGLLEIEIERHGSDQIERELSAFDLGRTGGRRAGQGKDLALQLHRLRNFLGAGLVRARPADRALRPARTIAPG